MIKIGRYQWAAGVPIPNCDCHGDRKAEFKIVAPKIGIRLCRDGLLELKSATDNIKEV